MAIPTSIKNLSDMVAKTVIEETSSFLREVQNLYQQDLREDIQKKFKDLSPLKKDDDKK